MPVEHEYKRSKLKIAVCDGCKNELNHDEYIAHYGTCYGDNFGFGSPFDGEYPDPYTLCEGCWLKVVHLFGWKSSSQLERELMEIPE